MVKAFLWITTHGTSDGSKLNCAQQQIRKQWRYVNYQHGVLPILVSSLIAAFYAGLKFNTIFKGISLECIENN